MENCNKLVRDNVASLLKSQGYKKIEGKKLKGKKYKEELYSLFWQEYKETLSEDKSNRVQVNYADMLEVIRTLMISAKINLKDMDFDKNQPLQWYENNSPSKQKLLKARMDLLQKFDELLQCKTEAVKDQLKDVLYSFKQLIEAHQYSFVQVEEVRRTMFKKLGGYNKGIYLVNVSKTRAHTV